MGRGKRHANRQRGQVQTRPVKTRLGKNPSKHFLPYQEQEIFDAVDMVASEDHRSLLEFRIRADTGKVTSLRFHKDGSYTDMKGNVYVRDYTKEAEEGKLDPVDRVICIEGNAEHEGLHCRVTDPVIFTQFKKDARDRSKKKGVKGGIEADRIWRIWNALEDGMIESWSRDNDGPRYTYLYGLAKLDPVVRNDELEQDVVFAAPKEGYHPTDARGKKLKKLPDGTYSAPKGTKISKWGDTPLGLPAQMDAAILTSALPQYRPGKLHPKVKACLDECRPYIHAAVHGNTADCVDAARNIYAILEKHDLLPEVQIISGMSMVMMPNGQPMPGSMGSAISAPAGMQFAMAGGGGGEDGDEDGDGGEGQQGQAPKNPMPGVQGAPQFSKELSESLSGGGGQGDEEGEEGDGEGGGAGASGEEGDEEGKGAAGEGDEDGEDGDEGDEGDEKGKGKGKGKGKDGEGDEEGDDADGKDGEGKDGKDGKDGQEDADGASKSSKDGSSADSDPSSKQYKAAAKGGKGKAGSGGDQDGSNELYGSGGYGGDDEGAHYDPNSDTSHYEDSATEQSLAQVREKLRNQMDDLAAQATQSAAHQKRQAGTGGVRWKTPPGQQLLRKDDMQQSRDTAALDAEGGKFTYTGRILAQRLKQIKDRYEEPMTNQLYGRLDRRRLVKAAAGNPRVMKRTRVQESGDVAIDVVFDLSGSTHGDRADQYRAGMMFGIAGAQANIPVSIYGGDEGHYEFKRPDEKDLKGMKAIFHAGGGGTPGARWVEFQRARMSLSDAEHKWAFVVTDGATFDPDDFRLQVLAAAKEGVTVFGLAYGCRKSDMDKQFGAGNWAMIDDYIKAPKIVWGLIEKTLKGRLGV